MRLSRAWLWLVLAVSLMGAKSAAFVVEPIADISRDVKSDIKFQVTVKGNTPWRFAFDKILHNGKAITPPPNMNLDADKGSFLWTPTPSQAGKYELAVAVTDAKMVRETTRVRIEVKALPVSNAKGPLEDLLRKWYAEGSAAGNVGDYYDNRDRDHSALGIANYPQLDIVTYTEAERKSNLDWAAQRKLLNHVTFGNSSTSAGVLQGGSNIRSYYSHPLGMNFLYGQYRGNNLYMYPGHHDHLPGRAGNPYYGDVFPLNSPYLIASQGSSGSDRPFMRAVAITLAAFHPAVKQKLIESQLLMPTVQMIFRSSNKHLTSPRDYLTGKAHPTVFEGAWVDELKMARMAHDLTLDKLPPMIQLKVVEEDQPVAGKDYFDPFPNEKLADTPAVIGRIFRSRNQVRRLVVSAEESYDVNRKPLAFHWVVLRGDAERIRIKPKNETGSVVEILAPYHERRRIEGTFNRAYRPKEAADPFQIESNRIDIGVFVHNGSHYSAPGFVCVHAFDTEARAYDAAGRILEIGYGVGGADLPVSDWPALFQLLKDKDSSPASRLLREPFKAEEIAVLVKVAEEHGPAWLKRKEAQEQLKTANETRKKAEEALKKAEAALKEAHKGGDEAKKALAERNAAQEADKKAKAEQQAARKAADAADKAADEILARKRAGLELPVKDLIERTLNNLKRNPRFLFDHRQDIDALTAQDSKRKARLQALQQQLLGLDILKKNNAGIYELHSIRAGNGPVADRLTPYEKTMLERAHAEVIGTMIFPKILSFGLKENFADFRLTARKSWRDVYRYDAQGAPLGWKRYDGTATQDFTAEGHLVLEKDAQGRPIKAQSVSYVMERTGPGIVGFGKLKAIPGPQIFRYDYDSEGKPRLHPAGQGEMKPGREGMPRNDESDFA